MPRKACVLYSGGKDSTRTIELVQRMGYEVSCLITMVARNPDSYMLHTSSIEWTKLSASALGIPIVFGETDGQKESELEDIKSTIESARMGFDFDYVAAGAIASVYQKERIEGICWSLSLKLVAPLWGTEQFSYLRNLVRDGYSFILTSVSAEGLDRQWLGRSIGIQEVELLGALSRKNGFNVAFEGGEAETFVLDCPIFRRGYLKLGSTSVDWRGSYGRLMIHDMELLPRVG